MHQPLKHKTNLTDLRIGICLNWFILCIYRGLSFQLSLVISFLVHVWMWLESVDSSFRIECRRVWSCLIQFATTNGSLIRPLFSFSTRKICSKRRSGSHRWPFAFRNTQVCGCGLVFRSRSCRAPACHVSVIRFLFFTSFIHRIIAGIVRLDNWSPWEGLH